MPKRSYRQYCGLAAALDVVAERWALLIVRDLTPGPRRFTDLFQALPGIATDVLAARLRSLEAAGAVEQIELRHPAPAKVYGLTSRGQELAAIAARLAQWGLPLLPPPTAPDAADHHRNPRWALQTMASSYRGGLPDGSYQWTIDDELLHIEVRHPGEADLDRTPDTTAQPPQPAAVLRYGHGVTNPTVDVRCSSAAFFEMLRRREVPDRDDFEVTDRDALSRLLRAMPLALGG